MKRCGFCKHYYDTSQKYRKQISKNIFTRKCIITTKEVQDSSQACSEFIITQKFWCQAMSGGAWAFISACIKKIREGTLSPNCASCPNRQEIVDAMRGRRNLVDELNGTARRLKTEPQNSDRRRLIK